MQDLHFSDQLAAVVAVAAAPGASVREFRSRRFAWRQGVRVCLADGASWWLPPIDLTLAATCAPFRCDANKALDLSAVLCEEDDILPFALYHAQMARMGLSLLRVNYDLSECAWVELTRFARPTDTLHFTRVVGEAFAMSAASWLPLLVNGRFVV